MAQNWIPESAIAIVQFVSDHLWTWLGRLRASGFAPLLQLTDARDWLWMTGFGLEPRGKNSWKLVFYFERKPSFDLREQLTEILRGTQIGIDVEIRVTGMLVPLSIPAGSNVGARYHDPKKGQPSGSLGGLVRSADGQHFYLGCNHVLSVNGEVFKNPETNAHLLHPAKVGEHVATAIKETFCVLNGTAQNLGDWALAKLIPEHKPSPAWQDSLPVRLKSSKPLDPTLPFTQTLLKVGNTTKRTEGHVSGGEAQFRLMYPELQSQFFNFSKQFRVTSTDSEKSFAEPGDSGSLVITSDGHPFGLVFAKDNSESIVCPLKPLFDQLNLEFVI